MKLIDVLSITLADSTCNKDPNSNPYHNYEHCKNVYKWCEKILAHEGKDISVELQWAALFHDFDHTGGVADDNTNIELAIAGFIRRYATEGNSYVSTSTVRDIIQCTKFVNGEFPNEPVTLEQRAIRDADLMSMFLPNEEAISALNGLYQEILINSPALTKEEFWNGNKAFFDKVTWYTDYGKQKALTLSDRINELTPLFL